MLKYSDCKRDVNCKNTCHSQNYRCTKTRESLLLLLILFLPAIFDFLLCLHLMCHNFSINLSRSLAKSRSIYIFHNSHFFNCKIFMKEKQVLFLSKIQIWNQNCKKH